MRSQLTIDFLFFIFSCQLVDKKLMRVVGKNYDWSGRKIRTLLEHGYIEEIQLDKPYKEKCLQITDKGFQYLSRFLQVEESVYKKMRTRIKGDINKYRQYKLGMTIQMLSRYFPEYCSEYISLETMLSNHQEIDMMEEIQGRKENNDYNDFFVSLKELRDMDAYGLKKLTATRAQGIIELAGNRYAVYNHNHKRMKSRGDFEEKFKDFFHLLFQQSPSGAIHFGRSYKVALDTIFKTTIKQRSGYILTKDIYEKNFFVPLTSSGSEQLMLYTIPNFREKIRAEMLHESEIERAKNTYYDGVDDEDRILYIGFECDISEIERILHTLETVKIASDIVVYCLPHQRSFYQTTFADRATIKTLTVEDICEVLKQQPEGRR